jgi:hypothetical protein
MIAQVEAALASAIGEHAGADLRSKFGLFMADHPGLLARAAIEAMREPTDSMIQSAVAKDDPGSSVFNEPYVPISHEEAWRAMIDAALGK